jgi:hypothetical protein
MPSRTEASEWKPRHRVCVGECERAAACAPGHERMEALSSISLFDRLQGTRWQARVHLVESLGDGNTTFDD